MDNNDDEIIKVNRKKALYELIYLPIFVILSFSLEAGEIISINYRAVASIFLFGLFHVLASNALSILYSWPRYVLPKWLSWIAILGTPLRVKLFGTIVIISTGLKLLIG